MQNNTKKFNYIFGWWVGIDKINSFSLLVLPKHRLRKPIREAGTQRTLWRTAEGWLKPTDCDCGVGVNPLLPEILFLTFMGCVG